MKSEGIRSSSTRSGALLITKVRDRQDRNLMRDGVIHGDVSPHLSGLNNAMAHLGWFVRSAKFIQQREWQLKVACMDRYVKYGMQATKSYRDYSAENTPPGLRDRRTDVSLHPKFTSHCLLSSSANYRSRVLCSLSPSIHAVKFWS